tara:strand:- start:874 stop:2007 length:1134 start_codon:yes stop_codon:yes gene_type:complete
MSQPISIAVVGLGFGAEFAAIYHRHPNVRKTVIVDSNPHRLGRVGDRFDIADRVETLDAVLADPSIDAVHIASGIPDHAEQTLAVLRAGKHCACAVPMATSIEDLQAIVDTVRETGLNYMMMETTAYDRAFLWVREQLEAGVFGDIQLLRGAHYQDMENWPAYWAGLPPMWYATHAVSPILGLCQTRATDVHCFGSGSMREELIARYDNPFPIETAIFRLAGSDAAAEVTRALFHSARPYVESFDLHGSEATFEWQQLWGEAPILHTLSPLGEGKGPRQSTSKRIELPDYAQLLPPEIGRFTQRGVYDENHQHLSFEHGGGHGGSHPHLCHEFVQSIVEARKPAVDEIRGADWTAPGICAHTSALRNGERVTVPRFD